MDDAFGNWLAGFMDGEGSFAIHRMGGKYPYYSFRLYIRLRSDDSKILEQIRDFFGFGVVRREANSSAYSTLGGELHTYSRLDIAKLGLCRAVCSVFEKYPLRAKKSRDFLVWRKWVLFASEHGQGVDLFPSDPVDELRKARTYS